MDFIIESNEIYLLNDEKQKIAYVKFPQIDENTVEVISTFVSDTLRGQGIAGKLMTLMYEELKKTDRKAKLVCEYAVKWFYKNVDKQDVLG